MRKFTTDQSVGAWLFKRPVRLGCLTVFALATAAGVVWALTSQWPLVALLPGAFLALALGGATFMYFTNRTVAALEGSLLYLPAPIFDGTFYPRHREGYVYSPRGSVVFVAVDVDNIRAIWRASDKEVERLSKARRVPHDSMYVGTGMIGTDPFQIARLAGGNDMRALIEQTFENRLVHDPTRAVGVRIKRLEPARFGLFGGALVDKYPVFEDVAVYVSVKDPEGLVEAVRDAQK